MGFCGPLGLLSMPPNFMSAAGSIRSGPCCVTNHRSVCLTFYINKTPRNTGEQEVPRTASSPSNGREMNTTPARRSGIPTRSPGARSNLTETATRGVNGGDTATRHCVQRILPPQAGEARKVPTWTADQGHVKR